MIHLASSLAAALLEWMGSADDNRGVAEEIDEESTPDDQIYSCGRTSFFDSETNSDSRYRQ